MLNNEWSRESPCSVPLLDYIGRHVVLVYITRFSALYICLLFCCNLTVEIIVHMFYKTMASCDVCKNVVSRNQLNIKGKECSGHFHASCVDMSKADLEYVNSENQLIMALPAL